MAGYLHELSETREMLDGRYDDLERGRVKAVDGDFRRRRLSAGRNLRIHKLARAFPASGPLPLRPDIAAFVVPGCAAMLNRRA
jgi:hypothetical protein